MSEKQHFDKLVYYTEGNKLVVERRFDAAQETVFKAFSDSKLLEAWWGPEGWQTTNARFEFKPDGVWHYCMRCMDKNQGEFFGQESWGFAVYKKMTVPEVIVYTDSFADELGNPQAGMPEIHITALFKADGQQTILQFISAFASEAAIQQVVEMGFVQGTESQFHRLDELLRTGL